MPLIPQPSKMLTWEMTIKEFPLMKFDISSVDFRFIQNQFTIEIQEKPMNNSLNTLGVFFKQLITGPRPFIGLYVPMPIAVTFVLKNDAGKVIDETLFCYCFVKKYDVDYDMKLLRPTIYTVEFVYSFYSIARYPQGRDEVFDPYAAYERAMAILGPRGQLTKKQVS